MSEKLIALKQELIAAQAVILPQIEGLHDFASLNIHSDTKAKVVEVTTDFERRRDLQVAALKALEDLLDDNYPTSAIREVLAGIYNDLSANVFTIGEAYKKFAPIEEALTATIIPGVPVLKPE